MKQEKKSPIVTLVKSKEVERVKTAIVDKYGFLPTDEYCRDLIAFVEQMAQETVF